MATLVVFDNLYPDNHDWTHTFHNVTKVLTWMHPDNQLPAPTQTLLNFVRPNIEFQIAVGTTYHTAFRSGYITFLPENNGGPGDPKCTYTFETYTNDNTQVENGLVIELDRTPSSCTVRWK